MEALVNGSLPEAERTLAEQHIATCEGCRLELELVRAIGSQEKAPATGQDDWTIDRIFGPDGKQGKEAEQAPSGAAPSTPPGPASPPAPNPTPASLSGAESAESNGPSGGASTFGEAPTNPAAPAEGMIALGSSQEEPSGSGGMLPPPQRSNESRAAEFAFGSAAPSPQEQPSREERGKKKGSPSWDFEPADAKAEVKPPEESLFFATEALRRRSMESQPGKGHAVRVILWGAGGLIGAILLAFSSWYVIHMSAPGPDSSGTQSRPSQKRNVAPESPKTPDPATTQPPAGGAAPNPAPETPDQTAHATPPAGATQVSASSTAQPQPLPVGSRPAGTSSAPGASPGLSPSTGTNPSSAGMTPLPATRPSTPSAGASHPASGAPNPRVTTPAPTPRATTAAPKPVAATAAPTPRVTTAAPKPVAPSQHVADGADHRAPAEPVRPTTRTVPRLSEDEVGAGESGATPAPPSARETDDEDLGPPPTSAPAATTHRKPPPVDVAKPAEEKPPEAAPPPDTPIERLHMATVSSEERGDLVDLRRLRVVWKEFLTRTVGPDRARAKREYADCLWAIQGLTGKKGDQKETLTAYHDYLLSAPAGGADSRSASRLRQLEEALAEKQ